MTHWSVPFFGYLAWIDIVLLAWFSVTILSVIYVAYDAFTRNPEMKVMRFGWVLVTLYLGPVGMFLYVMSCQEPVPGTHEDFIRPLWKQGLGSTIHCVAGDATGIVLAAAITAALGLPMWLDLIVEYVGGFAFGLLIFQALFMKDMMGGSYKKAVRHSLYAEWVSMNCMMAAMFPVMVRLMMGRDMRAMQPHQLLFWGVMSVAVGAGTLTAYPVNLWLVAKGLKHGMGTERALGQGGHSVAAEMNQTPEGASGRATTLAPMNHGSM
ncbi:MAG: DUF4396 domain-containing protein, partial [Longimicrobiales bacterium]